MLAGNLGRTPIWDEISPWPGLAGSIIDPYMPKGRRVVIGYTKLWHPARASIKIGPNQNAPGSRLLREFQWQASDHELENHMNIRRKALLALACAPLFWSASASPQPATEHQGLTLIRTKCFQCHTQSMWQGQRLNRRRWEAT